MKKYRKKPVVIEAMQFLGTIESAEAIAVWANVTPTDDDPNVSWITKDGDNVVAYNFIVNTFEGPLTARPSDMIIKGVKGEFYPCKLDIFEATYDVEE